MNCMKRAFGGKDIIGVSANSTCNEGQQLYRAADSVFLTQP